LTRPSPGGAALAGVVGASPQTVSGLAREVAATEQAFALDLMARLGTSSPNLVLSPSSIAVLLSMVEPGAVGPTQVGIAETLASSGLSAVDQALGWQALDAALARHVGHDGLAFDTANSAWLQTAFPVLPSYLSLLAADFGAQVHQQDMAGDPAGASRAIDDWVAARTKGHITDLLSPQELQDVVAVLVDAVYMSAPWATPFDPSATAPAPFHAAPGQTETVHMMSTPEQFEGPVSASPALDVAELAYKGAQLSALVLMPPVGQLGHFERVLTPGGLDQVVAGLHSQPALVELPRFGFSSDLRLNNVLSAMGMYQAFSRTADFSNVSPKPLRLSFVVHDAQIKVAEKGTEASAATGAGFAPTAVRSGPRTTVIFNHPFLFVVRDDSSGVVLFEAQVTNPARA
jgi:serpin B